MQTIRAFPNWVKLFLIAVGAFALATMAAYSVPRVNASDMEFRAPSLVRKAPVGSKIITDKVTAPRRASRGGVAAPPPAPGRARNSGRRR